MMLPADSGASAKENDTSLENCATRDSADSCNEAVHPRRSDRKRRRVYREGMVDSGTLPEELFNDCSGESPQNASISDEYMQGVFGATECEKMKRVCVLANRLSDEQKGQMIAALSVVGAHHCQALSTRKTVPLPYFLELVLEQSLPQARQEATERIFVRSQWKPFQFPPIRGEGQTCAASVMAGIMHCWLSGIQYPPIDPTLKGFDRYVKEQITLMSQMQPLELYQKLRPSLENFRKLP